VYAPEAVGRSGEGERPGRPSVRKVRSEHGTRVARSIKCSACGAKDTIHFAPRNPAHVLCRKCAADLLGVEDPDTNVHALHPFVCASCGRSGMTQARIDPDRDFICKDCLAGIESRQEHKTKSATRVSNKLLRVRRRRRED
jgi:hypothetical protein